MSFLRVKLFALPGKALGLLFARPGKANAVIAGYLLYLVERESQFAGYLLDPVEREPF
jgi:hypothetical protein